MSVSEGDQIGIIRNATVQMQENAPVKAFFVDASHFVLTNFYPVGAIDDAVAVFSNSNSSPGDKITATIGVITAPTMGKPGGGQVTYQRKLLKSSLVLMKFHKEFKALGQKKI